jgi:hypothetical protein
LRNLLSLFSSSLFGPKILSLSSPCAVLNPSFVHLSCWNTSSTGILSYTNINTAFMINILVFRDFRNINMSNRNEKQQQHTKHVSCMCVCVQKRNAYKINILILYLFQRNVAHDERWNRTRRSKQENINLHFNFLGSESLLQ